MLSNYFRTGFILLVLLGLNGCVASFDQDEYRQYIQVVTVAEGKSCQPEDVKLLVRETRFLYYYSLHIPSNSYSADAAKELYESSTRLSDAISRGDISPTYCKLKLEGISLLAQRFAAAIQGKAK